MATIEKRRTKNGSIHYRALVRLKGYPQQSGTFERKTDAKKWVQNTESAIRDGRYFKTSESKKHTLDEMIERYIENVLPLKPKSQKKQTQQLLWWKEQIGDYTIADVTPALISECRDRLLKPDSKSGKAKGPATVVRYMAALSHAFTIAMREWGWVEDSPMRKVERPKEPKGRVRFLSDEERGRLLNECRLSKNPFLYTIVVLALSTGARKSELLNATWKNIDLKKGVLLLLDTKNDETRNLHLTGHALELLKAQQKVRRIDTDYLFPSKNLKKPIDIRDAWERAIAKSKLQDFHFHDLRHSAASYLAMNGATPNELAEVLGHKTLEMVKRYAHLSEQHTATVVSSMNEKIFKGIADGLA